jgi:hypothetical protein
MDRDKINKAYKELLEEKIIDYLSQVKDISYRDAMDKYYKSELSKQINDGVYGIDNLDYRYLVNDLLENEAELFD